MLAEIMPTNTGFLDVQKFDFKQKVDFEIPFSATSEF